MKKAIPFLSALILALNLMTLASTATAQQSVLGEGLDCKWSAGTCSSGTEREICLEDGDGNACTCGTVTRPC